MPENSVYTGSLLPEEASIQWRVFEELRNHREYWYQRPSKSCRMNEHLAVQAHLRMDRDSLVRFAVKITTTNQNQNLQANSLSRVERNKAYFFYFYLVFY